MQAAFPVGRAMFAFGMAALGALALYHRDGAFLLEWTRFPETLPNRSLLSAMMSGFLTLAAAALVWPRTSRWAAYVFAAFWFFLAILHVPALIATWRFALGVLFECLALGFAALMLADAQGGIVSRIGRYGFGVCLPPFGIVHFPYPTFVAEWIPSWMPFRLTLAYATGVAHAAAGLAVLSGILARLASLLLAIMFSSWLVLVHAPRTLAALSDRHEWTVSFIAIAMSGAAWVLVGTIWRPRSPSMGELSARTAD